MLSANASPHRRKTDWGKDFQRPGVLVKAHQDLEGYIQFLVQAAALNTSIVSMVTTEIQTQ